MNKRGFQDSLDKTYTKRSRPNAHPLESLPIALFDDLLRIDEDDPRKVMENMNKLRQLNRGVKSSLSRVENEQSAYLFWRNWAMECFPSCTELPKDLQEVVDNAESSVSNAWYAHLVRSLDWVVNVNVREKYARYDYGEPLSMKKPGGGVKELTCSYIRSKSVFYERISESLVPLPAGIVEGTDEYYESGVDEEYRYSNLHVSVMDIDVAYAYVSDGLDIHFFNDEVDGTDWANSQLFSFSHYHERDGDIISTESQVEIAWNEMTAEDAYNIAKMIGYN